MMLKAAALGRLGVSLGYASAQGNKPSNQDFHGAMVPDDEPALSLKGIAVAVADGISSSPVARVAAEVAVKSFLSDYYCSSDAWTVKTAASRVIDATNAWLHGQSKGVEDRDQAHVTTFSALILKGRQGHIFHVGDSRIWRLSGNDLEPLTTDHRMVLSASEDYLGRALGLLPHVEIDYRQVNLSVGDVFVLTTDGVHSVLSPRTIAAQIAGGDVDLVAAASEIARLAGEAGSGDDRTVQLVRVETLPDMDFETVFDQAGMLPPAPLPKVPSDFEGYRIHRQIFGSSRSHIFLATETTGGDAVALKFPSADMRDNPDYLRRFAMEEWVARRVASIHVLRSRQPLIPRRSFYLVSDYVEGQTLAQWMIDHPRPDLAAVRDIVGQIAAGVRALHRMEVIHQDLRPENIMIDRGGTVKIIDFGSAKVAGLIEAAPALDKGEVLGTFQYAAPEYFVGEPGTELSDLYSLGAMTCSMLTGRLPYGAAVARAESPRQQMRLRFVGIRDVRPDVPGWVEEAIRKAVHPLPAKRQQALSEFVHDLSHPRPEWVDRRSAPLIHRSPHLVWGAVTALLCLVILVLVQRLLAAGLL